MRDRSGRAQKHTSTSSCCNNGFLGYVRTWFPSRLPLAVPLDSEFKCTVLRFPVVQDSLHGPLLPLCNPFCNLIVKDLRRRLHLCVSFVNWRRRRSTENAVHGDAFNGITTLDYHRVGSLVDCFDAERPCHAVRKLVTFDAPSSTSRYTLWSAVRFRAWRTRRSKFFMYRSCALRSDAFAFPRAILIRLT